MKGLAVSIAVVMSANLICGTAIAEEVVIGCMDEEMYLKWEDGFFWGSSIYKYDFSSQEWREFCEDGESLHISNTARAGSCVQGDGEERWLVNFELLFIKYSSESDEWACTRVDGFK